MLCVTSYCRLEMPLTLLLEFLLGICSKLDGDSSDSDRDPENKENLGNFDTLLFQQFTHVLIFFQGLL